MSRYDRIERTSPWIIVTVFLAGAVLVALGIIAGGLLLSVLGSATVVAATLAAIVLPRFGLSAPLSFSRDFPESVAENDAPSTEQRPSDEKQPSGKLPEVAARHLPEGPDKERAKPQYVNLPPTQHLRAFGGEEVIEVPEDQPRD